MKTTINLGYIIFLSVVAALGGFLFGYDTAVISGTIAQVTHLFQLDTLQQGWYVGCALIGSIVGVLFSGILSDSIGRKRTMILSAILFSTSAIGCAFCILLLQPSEIPILLLTSVWFLIRKHRPMFAGEIATVLY